MFVYSLILPGAGHSYGNRDVSSALFLLGVLDASLGVVPSYLEYEKALDDYHNSIDEYQAALTPDEIEETREQMVKAHDDADQKFKIQQAALVAVGGVWALNVLHALVARPAKATPSPAEQ